MRASHKSKRISWPPDSKLCQVRLFISEDSPSQVGAKSQDHLQAKSPWPSHPSNDNLPPGFNGLLSANESQIKLSDIPVIKWKCSIRILLDEEWRVVTGEESKEVEIQNQRELRMLEAFYPRASAIPRNPLVPSDTENSPYNDQQTIVIPILPIEYDDIEARTDPSTTTQTGSILPARPEIIAALSTIDQNLLIKILSNPKLIENLVASATSVSSNSTASSYIPPLIYPPPASSDQTNHGAPAPTKDASCYKNLIQQHGEETQLPRPVQVEPNPNPNQRPKIKKPCMYFNSLKGCRRGDKCLYQHDAADITYQTRNLNNGNNNISELQSAKRMRFYRH